MDIDKLMVRTANRPLPAGRMATGKALVISIIMGLLGISILSKLNFIVAILSFISIILYAVVYTPLKTKSPVAVFVGAIPGALPPLLGYFGSFSLKLTDIQVEDRAWLAFVIIPFILFIIQFIWQFPHFWAIAWFSDEDYRRGGIQLLPTTKKDKISAWIIFLSAFLMIPVAFLPYYYGMGTLIFVVIAFLGGAYFSYVAFRHLLLMTDRSAKKVMFASLLYLPIIQLSLLLDFSLKLYKCLFYIGQTC